MHLKPALSKFLHICQDVYSPLEKDNPRETFQLDYYFYLFIYLTLLQIKIQTFVHEVWEY